MSLLVQSALTRVASFGRKREKKQAETVQVYTDPSPLTTPRLQKPTTPRFLTPRVLQPKTTSVLSIELERESKSEPLGLKFAMLDDYYSGVIITEVSQKAAAAGLKPGDCVQQVGSTACTTVDQVEASLKRIAGEVEVQISRSKQLPVGWKAGVDENGLAVLKRDKARPETSRPQCELAIETVMGASTGMQLTNNSKGQVIIHSIQRDSVFAKHVKVGDKLTSVNGLDFVNNALGAGRSLTSTNGTLRVRGTFVAPSVKCALSGCECCKHLTPPEPPPPPPTMNPLHGASVTAGDDEFSDLCVHALPEVGMEQSALTAPVPSLGADAVAAAPAAEEAAPSDLTPASAPAVETPTESPPEEAAPGANTDEASAEAVAEAVALTEAEADADPRAPRMSV